MGVMKPRVTALTITAGVLGNLLLLMLDVAPAGACTQDKYSIERVVREAPVLARLEEISRRSAQDTMIATVEVVEAFRGSLPSEIEVDAGPEGSNCGTWSSFTADTVVALYRSASGIYSAGSGVSPEDLAMLRDQWDPLRSALPALP